MCYHGGMKNTCSLLAILLVIGAFAACSINIPWEVMDDYDGVRVVMHVTPDDADVLLNGRIIGAAYEFASANLALRLASRENELAFRKKGFREKVVDLRAYSSRRITLKIDLESATAPAAVSPAPAAPPAAAEDQKAYEAQSEPIPPQPEEKLAPAQERLLTQVTLTVTPEEASVYIDSRFWGLAPAAGKPIFLRLPPGKYAFSAYKPGYRIYSRDVLVPKQEKFVLAIDLQK